MKRLPPCKCNEMNRENILLVIPFATQYSLHFFALCVGEAVSPNSRFAVSIALNGERTAPVAKPNNTSAKASLLVLSTSKLHQGRMLWASFVKFRLQCGVIDSNSGLTEIYKDLLNRTIFKLIYKDFINRTCQWVSVVMLPIYFNALERTTVLGITGYL